MYGAGGHATVLRDVAVRCGFAVFAYVVDGDHRHRRDLAPVFPSIHEAILAFARQSANQLTCTVAIGMNGHARQLLTERVRSAGLSIASLVDPSSHVSDYSSLGEGVQVLPGATVGPLATIGSGTILNTGCDLEHGANVGEFSHLAPGSRVLGEASIGDLCLVGAGSTVLPGVRICSEVTIGAMSLVNRDISEPGTYFGVPARRYI